jgi:hypothetical protein
MDPITSSRTSYPQAYTLHCQKHPIILYLDPTETLHLVF